MAKGKWAVLVVALCLVVAVAAVAYAAGKAKPTVPVQEVVRAQRFELVDTAGEVYARLGFEKGQVQFNLYDKQGQDRASFVLFADGMPGLVLFDDKGEQRLSLSASSDASTLEMMDAAGRKLLNLSVGPGKSSGLGVFDEQQKLRAILTLGPNGTSLVGVGDAAGNCRASLEAEADTGAMVLRDSAGKSRAALAVVPDGGVGLNLRDTSEKLRAHVSVGKDGKPRLLLLDADEKERVVLGPMPLEVTRTSVVEERSESSLVLFDKEGKVLWEAP